MIEFFYECEACDSRGSVPVRDEADVDKRIRLFENSHQREGCEPKTWTKPLEPGGPG